MQLKLSLSLLPILLTVVSCGPKPAATGVSFDSVFRPLIPSDTKVLAEIDIDKLRRTPLYRQYQKNFALPLLDAMRERVGLDPIRDLSTILIVWNGKQPIVMAHGRFKTAAVEEKLLALGAQRSNYERYTLFSSDGNPIAFLENSVAISGLAPAVRSALDTNTRGDGEIPEELQERLQSLPKGDPIWAAARGGLPFAELPMRSDYESALSNIVGYVTGASLGVAVDTGFHCVAYITCTSEQGARRVHDGLRAAVALGRLTTKDDQQDLLHIYDAIQVDRDKQVVRIMADFPGELAEKLYGLVRDLNSRPGSRLH